MKKKVLLIIVVVLLILGSFVLGRQVGLNTEDDKNTITLGIEGIMRNGGFYITSIKSGGNAENADLEIGNIITEIDKNKVTSSETIEKVLYKKNSGDSVSLKVKYIENNMYKEKDIIINLK